MNNWYIDEDITGWQSLKVSYITSSIGATFAAKDRKH